MAEPEAAKDDLDLPIVINGEDYKGGSDHAINLVDLGRRFANQFGSIGSDEPMHRRVRDSLADVAPEIPEASRNTARELVEWTRGGSPLRALLVISVGTITLLALTGFMVFMLFFLAATFNAIIIAFLMSLAAAGGFLALFFASLTVIYVAAMSVAVLAISTTTVATMIAVVIATGWIGFFWIIWFAARKSLDLTKRSLSTASSALSANSTPRQSSRAPIKTE